jgi:hypothetical protein
VVTAVVFSATETVAWLGPPDGAKPSSWLFVITGGSFTAKTVRLSTAMLLLSAPSLARKLKLSGPL